MGLFHRFVEIGRVVYINYGPYTGKIAVIIDIIDQNRIFVDGPTFGVKRHVLNIKWAKLTSIVVKLSGRGARQKVLEKAIKDQDVQGKWDKTTWAKNLAVTAKRASLTDFERFKLTKAKKTRAGLVRHEIALGIRAKMLFKSEVEKRRAARNKKSASTRPPPRPVAKREKREKRQEREKKGLQREEKGFAKKKTTQVKRKRVSRPRIAIGSSRKGAITSLDRQTRISLIRRGFKLRKVHRAKRAKKVHTTKAPKAPKSERAIQKA
eukprot:TRINITY_DN251_c0_g2_i1.p1 TRINITY_DN251_c0_g2~~TRINITY_DN251_c0_g2_i1.p1  ORF type:complete len:265 (-),score=46.91 TRINITY_DN251_c0_g2_i1:77-871(-)